MRVTSKLDGAYMRVTKTIDIDQVIGTVEMLSTLCVNELFINTTTKVYELANVKSKYEGYKWLANLNEYCV